MGRRWRGRGAAVAWLLAIALSASAEDAGSGGEKAGRSSQLPKGRRPMLIVMNEVVDGLWPKLKAPAAGQARRVSVRNGLLGVGAYDPPGGADAGVKAPPLHVYPRAGAGNSLGVDPITRRSHWTHLP